MTSTSTDTGIAELDKLIHSIEFENHQLVKMIEKENQLMNALQEQIHEQHIQTHRLEEEISRFDEDTKRLHKQFTTNRDNIASLNNTLSIMADHEQALSKQLEILKAKSEEDSKNYKNQVANYTSIRDDYMKKYKSFPLAIELETKRQALVATQEKLDEIDAVKQSLKERIDAKEEELDSKIMTRIVVKIAKTKVATSQLEKEIHKCLTEKTVLLEKLKELQISRQPEQEADQISAENAADHQEEMISSENGDVAMEEDTGQMQKPSDEIEGFASMHIEDNSEQLPNQLSDKEQISPQAIKLDLYKTNHEIQHFQGETLDLYGEDCGEGTHAAANFGLLMTQECDTRNEQHVCSAPSSGDKDFDHQDMQAQMSVQTQTSSQVQADDRLAEATVSEEFIACATKNHTSSTTSSSLLRLTTASKSLSVESRLKGDPHTVQQAAQPSTTRTACEEYDKNESRKPPSLRFPRLTVPKPPRIPPLPVFRSPAKPAEQQKAIKHVSEIKQPLPPPASTWKNANQRLNFSRFSSLSSGQGHLKPQTAATTSSSSSLSKSEPSYSSKQVHPVQSLPSTSGPTVAVPSEQVNRTKMSAKQHAPVKLAGQSAENETMLPSQSNSMETRETHQISTKNTSPEMSLGTSGGQESAFSMCPPFLKQTVKSTPKVGLGSDSPIDKSKKPTTPCKPPPPTPSKFGLSSLFSRFESGQDGDGDDENDEDNEAAPTSLFSLFNMTQTQSDSSTEGETSKTSDDGPYNLFSLFSKTQESEGAKSGFSINLMGDTKGDEESEGRSFFDFGGKGESDDEADRPMFNLF